MLELTAQEATNHKQRNETMTLNQQRQAAYDRNDKNEVARLNVEMLKRSRKELTIDEIFAKAAKRKKKANA
jgi:hypothetical protein